MPNTQEMSRKKAVGDLKKTLILDAAKRVFEREGLEKASLRAIAKEAGYTPAALYFHFESKEAVYADLLADSLLVLKTEVEHAADQHADPAENFRAAAQAYFRFYLENPKDLDLGFYLWSGGMSPKGLGKGRDDKLNSGLMDALQPIRAAAFALSHSALAAQRSQTEIFAYANGVLLLVHTGRIRLFEISEMEMMDQFVTSQIKILASTESLEND